MTQTHEERLAWQRDYERRPEVRVKKRAQRQASKRRALAAETPTERAERLAYQSWYARERRAQETPTERAERLAKRRAYYRAQRSRG